MTKDNKSICKHGKQEETVQQYMNIKIIMVESGLTRHQSREPTEERMRWRILGLLYRCFREIHPRLKGQHEWNYNGTCMLTCCMCENSIIDLSGYLSGRTRSCRLRENKGPLLDVIKKGKPGKDCSEAKWCTT